VVTHENHIDDRQSYGTLEEDLRVSCTVDGTVRQDSRYLAGVVVQRNWRQHEGGWRVNHKASRHQTTQRIRRALILMMWGHRRRIISTSVQTWGG